MAQAAVSWGTVSCLSTLKLEERNARARRVWLKFEPRMKKEMAVGFRRMDEARACNLKMPGLPYITLLVVTARAAWFNFRGWKKRL